MERLSSRSSAAAPSAAASSASSAASLPAPAVVVEWPFVVVWFLCREFAPRSRERLNLALCSRALAMSVKAVSAQTERLRNVLLFRSSETSFVALLRHALRTEKPLHDLSSGASVPLFRSLPTLMKISQRLLNEVAERMACWQSQSLFGDIFIALGSALPLYAHFTSQCEHLSLVLPLCVFTFAVRCRFECFVQWVFAKREDSKCIAAVGASDGLAAARSDLCSDQLSCRRLHGNAQATHSRHGRGTSRRPRAR